MDKTFTLIIYFIIPIMIYSKEVDNMCVVAKGPTTDRLQFLKKENGSTPRRLRIFLVILTVWVGVLLSRVLASSL